MKGNRALKSRIQKAFLRSKDTATEVQSGGKDVMEWVKQLLLKIDEFNQNQWLFVSVVTTSSGLWFPFIVTYFGVPLRLLTKDAAGVVHWKPIGIILTMLTILWSFVSLLAHKYSEYRNRANNGDTDNKGNLFESILDSLCAVEETTEMNNESVLDKRNDKLSLGDYCKLHTNSLPNITEQMCKVLSKLLSTREFNLREKDIVVNIYYCFPTLDNHWYRANTNQPQFGLKMAKLMQKNTTFYECVNERSSYIFHYSKKKAAAENHYVLDNKDYETQSKDGSIACYRFSAVRYNKTYMRCVVAIATYGKRFAAYKTEDEAKDKVENIQYNLCENIFKPFQPFITNALFHLYMMQRLS